MIGNGSEIRLSAAFRTNLLEDAALISGVGTGLETTYFCHDELLKEMALQLSRYRKLFD